MPARGSFRRRLEWVLLLGGVAAACGGDTTSGGGASLTGGTANPSGGTIATSGGTAAGGTANLSGGTSATTGGTSSGGTDSGGMSSGGSNSGGTGNPSGGTATGGMATGGTRNAFCDVVPSLPSMGTLCNTTGESQCDANGNRCTCERIWYCNDACPASQPTPNTSCASGAACAYNGGTAGCACVDSLWICLGVSDCPSSMPTTGNACNNLTGIVCDYPNTNPALHFVCYCSANADAGSGSSWSCVQSAYCPTVQPPYGSAGCPGTAVCTYSTPPYHCGCYQAGTPWVCGPAGAG